MARPPQLRKLVKADYPGAPDWFGRFIDLLGPFVGDVTNALSGALDDENIQKQFESFRLTTGNTLAATFAGGRVAFKNRLKVRPKSVQLGRCVPAVALAYDGTENLGPFGPPMWDYDQRGQVVIRYIAGLEPNTPYDVTLTVE